MSSNQVYVVVVTGKLKEGQMPQFIENFKPLAQHVQENEEGALTYQLSTGGDDPNDLCIYERYISKEYLENVHWQSAPFKQFGAKNAADGIHWELKQVIKYYETEVGFMSK
ncbi:hypothetical protein CEUSTIGMA_g7184.t1 [Chlamydomonas eustigma]|uniref:ABM domain-containing protein n=1 Tax=Chlamydomonas eustigma TaxID=1157962 RepID=A0A250X9H2_9CHLO|nr:hypothetical protein CEUSTIGMA_g7184.t1 [Chlamydomonas eustigma]|eukprot:GAX79743.1 hypothetical protein CEUSTIGMA_g7184.t1 [Chlamydomonas eustigma]